MTATTIPFIAAFLTVVVTALGQVLLKYGVSRSPLGAEGGVPEITVRTAFEVFFNPYVLSGFVVYAGSTLIWMYVLSKLPLSTAYPFVGLSIVFTSLAGVLFFGERVSTPQIIGTLPICAGVVLVARGSA